MHLKRFSHDQMAGGAKVSEDWGTPKRGGSLIGMSEVLCLHLLEQKAEGAKFRSDPVSQKMDGM